MLAAVIGLTAAHTARAASHNLPAKCVQGSLASYIALGATGCSIDVLKFSEFDFSIAEAGGGARAVSADEILLTPILGSHLVSLAISSDGFDVSGDEFAHYVISWTADPHPEIFDYSLELETFTPVFPGKATVTSDLCIGEAFVKGVCDAPTGTVSVFHNGTTADVQDQLNFRAVNILGVQTRIDLDANGASSQIAGFQSGHGTLPEPGTFGVVALGLAAAIAGAKRYC